MDLLIGKCFYCGKAGHMKNKNFLKKTGKKHNGNNNNKIDNKTNESE